MVYPWKIRRVLFATDFLESSRLALDYAVAIASRFDAALVMLHVVELSNPAREAEVETHTPSVSRRLAEQRLAGLASGVRRNGITVETLVLDGIPCETILKTIPTLSVDLLVIGIHGVHHGLEHLLIGSNAEHLLLSAECPTLTVGAHVLAGVDLGFHPREILFLSDLTPASVAAAPYALQLAREFQTELRVLQLMPERAVKDKTIQSKMAAEWDHQVTAEFGRLGESVDEWSKCSKRNVGLDDLQLIASSYSDDLILIGVKPETKLGRHLHASFAYYTLAHAACPVLSIG